MKNLVSLDVNTQFVPRGKHITSPLQSPAGKCYVRFNTFTAVTLKNAVFWDVTLCDSCRKRRFGGIYRLHYQVHNVNIVPTSPILLTPMMKATRPS
jgi:hypothetical protein